MRNLVLIGIMNVLLSLQILYSQRNPDPKATALLEEISMKFQSLEYFEFSFSTTIDYPESPDEEWSGIYQQAGDSFHLSIPQYDLYSDGSSLWTADHSIKEILIQDYEPESGSTDLLNPTNIFSLHLNEDLDYMTSMIGQSNGTEIHEIEFKPLDPTAAYAKLKLMIDLDSRTPKEAWMINKDGSRYVLQITTVNSNPSKKSRLTFDKSKYKDYFLEDLRF